MDFITRVQTVKTTDAWCYLRFLNNEDGVGMSLENILCKVEFAMDAILQILTAINSCNLALFAQ